MVEEIFDVKMVLRAIPCTHPALTCCSHRMVAPWKPADNVQRCEVWCSKWRLQRDREHVIRGCHQDYPKWELENENKGVLQ
jgi:hypothetical protein